MTHDQDLVAELGFKPCRWGNCFKIPLHEECTRSELELQRREHQRWEQMYVWWIFASLLLPYLMAWQETYAQEQVKEAERIANRSRTRSRLAVQQKLELNTYYQTRLKEAGIQPKFTYENQAGEIIRMEWVCPACDGSGLRRGCGCISCQLCQGHTVLAATHAEIFTMLIREKKIK